MSLQNWAANGWLRVHQPSPQEMQELLAMVEFAEGLREEVLAWLRQNHPQFLRPENK